MLEAVVEDEYVGLVEADGFLGGGQPIGVDDDGGAAAGLGQQGRFVGKSVGGSSIAAGEDGTGAAFGGELVGQPDDQRGFAGSAGGEIADADDDGGGRMGRQEAAVVELTCEGLRLLHTARKPNEEEAAGRPALLLWLCRKQVDETHARSNRFPRNVWVYKVRIFRIMASAICRVPTAAGSSRLGFRS